MMSLISLTEAEQRKRALPVPDEKIHKLKLTNLYRQKSLSEYPDLQTQ